MCLSKGLIRLLCEKGTGEKQVRESNPTPCTGLTEGRMDWQKIQKMKEQVLSDWSDVAVSEMEDSRINPRFQA